MRSESENRKERERERGGERKREREENRNSIRILIESSGVEWSGIESRSTASERKSLVLWICARTVV